MKGFGSEESRAAFRRFGGAECEVEEEVVGAAPDDCWTAHDVCDGSTPASRAALRRSRSVRASWLMSKRSIAFEM